MLLDLKEKTCCFTGHRDLPPEQLPVIRTAILSAVEDLLSRGVIYYGVGGALGFDTLAAETLFHLRTKHPRLRVILVYPFPGFQDRWPREDRRRYQALLPLYDKTVCVGAGPGREAYLARNRHLVDHSGWCIAWRTRDTGGTAHTVLYARRQGCRVVELAQIFPPLQ